MASLRRVNPEADLALRREALERSSSCTSICRSCWHLRHSCSRMSPLTAGCKGGLQGGVGGAKSAPRSPTNKRYTGLTGLASACCWLCCACFLRICSTALPISLMCLMTLRFIYGKVKLLLEICCPPPNELRCKLFSTDSFSSGKELKQI